MTRLCSRELRGGHHYNKTGVYEKKRENFFYYYIRQFECSTLAMTVPGGFLHLQQAKFGAVYIYTKSIPPSPAGYRDKQAAGSCSLDGKLLNTGKKCTFPLVIKVKMVTCSNNIPVFFVA